MGVTLHYGCLFGGPIMRTIVLDNLRTGAAQRAYRDRKA